MLAEYPFRSKFVGERAVDLGGVTRDVFSAFFEEAYAKCFDGSSLLTPSDNPLIDSSTLSTVGTIISHVYLITGMLSVQIAFPCLAAVLLPSVSGVPEEVVMSLIRRSRGFHGHINPYDGEYPRLLYSMQTYWLPISLRLRHNWLVILK